MRIPQLHFQISFKIDGVFSTLPFYPYGCFHRFQSPETENKKKKTKNFFFAGALPRFDLSRRSLSTSSPVEWCSRATTSAPNKAILFDFEFFSRSSFWGVRLSHHLLFWHVIKSEIMNMTPDSPTSNWIIIIIIFSFHFYFTFLIECKTSRSTSFFHPHHPRILWMYTLEIEGRRTRAITIFDSINLSKRLTRCTLEAHHKLILLCVGRLSCEGKKQTFRPPPFIFIPPKSCSTTRKTLT